MHPYARSLSKTSLLAVLLVLGACADRAPAMPPTRTAAATPTAADQPDAGAAVAQGGGQDSSDGAAGTNDVATLDDTQMVAVVIALDQGAIQQAQLAQSKAKSPEVRNFASHMANAHQNMLTKAQREFAAAQLTPGDSVVSQQLQADVQSQLSTLESMTGRDFDRTYVDDQVLAHQHAIDLLDRMLLRVKNARLKASLQSEKTKVEGHARDAKALQEKLSK